MNLTNLPKGAGIIVFDGFCVICSTMVRILSAIDRRKTLWFTTFESESWKNLANSDAEANSIVFIKDGMFYFQSEAVIKVIENLSYPWRLASVLKFIPFSLRERLYKYFASTRYRIFKKKEECTIPSPSVKKRYLN